MGYVIHGMDIRIQLLPANEVPQGSAKTGPGYQISDGCVHVSVLAPLPAMAGADTLTGNISGICHQLPPLPHTPQLHLQSSISTKEMKTGLGFYMHRAIHHMSTEYNTRLLLK